MNPFKYWLVIKDDSKRTFEVIGQEANTNSFTNKVIAMQRKGMNVSGVTPPVSNKTSSKDLLKFTAYIKEKGLYERLLTEYRQLTIGSIDHDEISFE